VWGKIQNAVQFGYHVSGILIFISILIAYFQLKSSTQASRSEREYNKKKISIEMCDRYLTSGVSKSNELYNLCKEKNISIRLEKNVTDFVYDDNRSSWLQDPNNWSIVVQSMLLCNELELIASSFLNDVANIDIGFDVIGKSYCATVENNFDLISLVRRNKVHPGYENTVRLYGKWNPKLQMREIDAVIDTAVEKKLSMLGPSRLNVGRNV